MSMPSTQGSTSPTTSISLSDLTRILVRGAPLALVAMVVAGALAFFVSREMEPTYRASTVLVATQTPATFVGVELVTPPPVDPRVYQSALIEGDLIEGVVDRLEGRRLTETELTQFKQRVRVNVENQLVSSLVRLSVTDADAERAATYANEFAAALVEWDRARALRFAEQGIAALEQAVAELDAELATAAQAEADAATQARQALIATLREQRARELDSARARSASAVVVGGLGVLSPAAVPERAISPRLVFNTVIASVLGLVIGYFIQLLRWSQRNEVRDRRRLAEVTGMPVLAEFPRHVRQRARDSGEAGSFLRASVLREAGDFDQLVLAVTSPTGFDEKLGVAAALSERLAVSGYRTLLIDGDLRKIGSGVGLDADTKDVTGFAAHLMNVDRPLHPVRVLMNQQRSFDFVPATESVSRSSELLEYGLQAFLERTTDRYDVVVIDLPPVLALADTVTVAPRCSGVVLCVEQSTESQAARDAARLLVNNGARVLGTVLTGVTPAGATLMRRPEVPAGGAKGAASRSAQTTKDAKAFVRVKQR